MTATVTPVDGGGYYTDYLGKGDGQVESLGQSSGAGMSALGMHGELTHAQALLLCEGYHPRTGEPLVKSAGTENHRTGLDVTFSAPKSVSVAWAFADTDMHAAIQKAHDDAVSKALSNIEKDLIRSRTGAGGKGEQVKGGMVNLTFRHSTSRSHNDNTGKPQTPDMQLHSHNLIMNLVHCEDNTWRTLHNDNFFKKGMAKTLGAMYRAELAKNMRELGFTIEPDKKDVFKLSGIDNDIVKAFSKRRVGIEKLVKEAGISNPKTVQKIVNSSKVAKNHALTMLELSDSWRYQLSELGYTPEQVIDAAMSAESEAKMTVIARDALTAELTKSRSTFHEHDIMRSAYIVCQNLALGADKAKSIAAEIIADGEILMLKDGVFTTRTMLASEVETLAWAEQAAKQGGHVFNDQIIERAISKNTLTEEQAQAMRNLSGGAGIGILKGMAGTGKSRTMLAYREAAEQSGFTVHGMALAGKAASGLQEGAGITSSTIHRALIDIDNGKLKLTDRDIIVMDEAAMADNRLVSRVAQACKKSGAKLVMLGDSKQLQAVGAGGLFEHISEKIGSSSLTEIWRQNNKSDIKAVHMFAEGDAATALEYYDKNNRLHTHEKTADAMLDAVSAWHKSSTQITDKLLIASRRDDVEQLNILARQAMKETLGVSVFYKTSEGAIELAEGERIIFKKNDKNTGVMNGEVGTVVHAGHDEMTGAARIIVQKDSGEQVSLDDKNYSEIQYGYAVTGHASQGQTVQESHLYMSRFTSRESAYVVASRHKEMAHIYASEEEMGKTDIKSELAFLMSKSDKKHTALKAIEDGGISIRDVLDGRADVQAMADQITSLEQIEKQAEAQEVAHSTTR